MGYTPVPLPRTVILDYYDSYTNNLLTLFTQLYSNKEVLEKVVVIKSDCFTWNEFESNVLPHIDCIVLSPGPGRPDREDDIGFALDLLRAHHLDIPILGVCLGHQAIGVAFGGKIAHAPQITHGQVVRVAPVQPPIGLFASPTWTDPLGESYEVVVYNSLVVDRESLPDGLEVTAWSAGEGEVTIQGLRHREYPIWGVQYHPESISSTRGVGLLQAFLYEVHQHHSRPPTFPPLKEHIVSSCAYRVSTSGLSTNGRNTPLSTYPSPPGTPPLRQLALGERLQRMTGYVLKEKMLGEAGRDWTTSDAFEALVRKENSGIGQIWLDGQSPNRPTTTTLASPSFAITYSLSSHTLTLHQPSKTSINYPSPIINFWDLFSRCQEDLSSHLRTSRGNEKSKFRGGWVGWFGYEMKEESLTGHRSRWSDGFPSWAKDEDVDACWSWVDRFVERSNEGEWTVRGVVQDDQAGQGTGAESELLKWLEAQGISFAMSSDQFKQYTTKVESTLSKPHAGPSHPVAETFPAFHPIITGAQHRDSIDKCREAIRQGESYELTLTTRFNATLPSANKEDETYSLYLRLRARNPAYYSTYISFPTLITPRGEGVFIISSSPERFLKIDERRNVEMMPIKGTMARVKPGQCVCTPTTGCRGLNKGGEECTLEGKREDTRRADWLRNDKKERAENLMIVDLIRADLLGCCIPSTVKVPKLIALESYGVHNLVTTVTGLLAENVGPVDAVKRCFPPGSMTGAPKLRTVQLLEEYEGQRRRGIYSGALGYFSLDGATDLSVVIRTIVVEGSHMSIGSGGGITWLSDRDREWEEVLTKVRSVVGDLEGVK